MARVLDMFLENSVCTLGGQSFLFGPGAARRLAHTHLAAVLSAERGWGGVLRPRMQRLRT